MSKLLDIRDYHEIKIDIDDEVNSIVQKYGDKICEDVKEYSPKSNRRRKGHKPYADTWTATRDKPSVVVIHNKENYRLTHLLENGHFIVNKKGGVGWSAPKPHIGRAFDKEREAYISAMEHIGINVVIK